MAISMVLTIVSGVLSAAGAILGVAARTQSTKEYNTKVTNQRLAADEFYRKQLLDQTARHIKAYDYTMNKANETTEEKES